MTVVTNATLGVVLASPAETARSAWSSFKGLMGRTGLAEQGGLVLPRTRGVHTHFMRFPIDVIFYDRKGVVLGIEHAMQPWRFSSYHLRAHGAVELPAGTTRASGTERGHVLTLASQEV